MSKLFSSFIEACIYNFHIMCIISWVETYAHMCVTITTIQVMNISVRVLTGRKRTETQPERDTQDAILRAQLLASVLMTGELWILSSCKWPWHERTSWLLGTWFPVWGPLNINLTKCSYKLTLLFRYFINSNDFYSLQLT